MAKYDVFPNPGTHGTTTPFLLEIQSDLLDGFETRVVIPLRRPDYFPSIAKRPERLLPTLRIANENFILDTPAIGAVPRRILKQPVSSAASEHDRIAAALDFLFQGF